MPILAPHPGRPRRARRTLGREFTWVWSAYAVSALGTWIAFDAFSLVAILALHASPAQVSLLASAGLAVGAVAALPLGPWVECRRKRPVMVAMDLIRFGALATVPLAYAAGRLSLIWLIVVAVVVRAADIAFRAASGACVKALVAGEQLIDANARLESTTWTATMIGPPLGGAAVGLLGPVVTVVADAVSYLLSAAGIRAIAGDEPEPRRDSARRMRGRDLLDGWRFILGNPTLAPLFANVLLVNGLIMAPLPLIAVLMLGQLHFAAWQYGLAFAAPCLGGLIGSRMAGRLVSRFGRVRVLRGAGTLRVCWSLGLALIPAGVGGLVLVMAVQFALVTCCGVFNPVLAAHRLAQTESDRVARTLAAWSASGSATTAAMTAIWGALAAATSLRIAIATAGALMLATPLLLAGPLAPRQRARVALDRSVLSADTGPG